jgi:hypothetical protein
MSTQIHTLQQLALAVRQDELLLARLRDDPAVVLSEVAARVPYPPHREWMVYQTIVCVLGAVALTAAGVAAYSGLRPTGTPIPDLLLTLGSASIGALVGLLAPSPVRAKDG